MSRSLKPYGHRLRDLVRQTGDLTIATSADVPRSTAAGWLRRSGRTTVTLDALTLEQQELQAEVLRLQCRVEELRTVARNLSACPRALDIDVSRNCIPDGELKSTVLRAVERGQEVLQLRQSLAMISLSLSRF